MEPKQNGQGFFFLVKSKLKGKRKRRRRKEEEESTTLYCHDFEGKKWTV